MTDPVQPLLLDTVAFIFWHADSPRLSPLARRAMLEAPARTVYVSAASAFEIATKVRLGKLTVPAAMLNDFAYVVEADGFRLLVLKAAVVTNDTAFADLGVDVFW